jgi:FixJ family two-component response regulator
MDSSQPTVFVVDDDEAVRDSVRVLLKTVGINAETFASGREFLDSYDPDRPGCLVLDIRMPGMSGMELQEQLVARNAILPVIFITGHGDVPMAVHALRSGAVDFMQKPFSEQALLDRIQQVLEQNGRDRQKLANREAIRARIDRLTPRERQVMKLVVDGNANKVIAIDLGIGERTVEIHRARVMEKMEASSLPHLVRMFIKVSEDTR